MALRVHASPLRRTRVWLLSGVAIVGAVLCGTCVAYVRDTRATRERLSAESRIVRTWHGAVEFAERGDGPPVLVIHGSGGGYDQGLLLARAFGGDEFRWISPSRFGYLRSSLPADASTATQADAFAELLDTLGVRSVAIVAMSGGVPPALQLALRHPERVRALVLLSSAPYTPLSAAEQKLPVPVWVYQALFRSDFPYWLLLRIARGPVEGIFDAGPERTATLPAEERAMVADMIDAFHPASARIRGVRNEGAAIDPRARYPIAAIAAPTLVVHARDDHINPFSFGAYTARHIPGAQFVPLENGGHLLLGHQREVRTRVAAFLHEYAGPAAAAMSPAVEPVAKR